MAEPKRRRPRPGTPGVAIFKDIFSFDDRGPSRRAVGTIDSVKDLMVDHIFVIYDIDPKFIRQLN